MLIGDVSRGDGFKCWPGWRATTVRRDLSPSILSPSTPRRGVCCVAFLAKLDRDAAPRRAVAVEGGPLSPTPFSFTLAFFLPGGDVERGGICVLLYRATPCLCEYVCAALQIKEKRKKRK